MGLNEKICSKCGETKPQAEYYKDVAAKSGRKALCKTCKKKYAQIYYAKNREKCVAYIKRYHKENREHIREQRNKPETLKMNRNNLLLKKYNITLEQYNLMAKTQNNICGICEKPETRKIARLNESPILSVDHCHKTGQIRMLLCSRCNTILGLIEDDLDLLYLMISYLKQYQGVKIDRFG